MQEGDVVIVAMPQADGVVKDSSGNCLAPDAALSGYPCLRCEYANAPRS